MFFIGTIHAQMISLGHEGNWAGLQLRYIPEPSTIVLLGLGTLGLVASGRPRREFTEPELRLRGLPPPS